jgi:hypothetical protein
VVLVSVKMERVAESVAGAESEPVLVANLDLVAASLAGALSALVRTIPRSPRVAVSVAGAESLVDLTWVNAIVLASVAGALSDDVLERMIDRVALSVPPEESLQLRTIIKGPRVTESVATVVSLALRT